MQLSAKLLFGFLVASSATGVLATFVPDWRGYGTCADGSPRGFATAASQAGPLPHCSSYVSTSVITQTNIAKATVTAVVTKTVVSEKDVKTTVVNTKTVTGKPHTVTTTVAVTATSGATVTTTTTLPVVTVMSTSLIMKRDHHPVSTSTKCSCIVLLSTTTVSSTKTQTSFLTKATTILKTEIEIEASKTTLTVAPTSTTTVLITTTIISTTTTTQTLASTTTVVRVIPSACANLAASPASVIANTLSHPEGNYESISSGQGAILPDIVACCASCYNLPGCFSFNFANFNPEQIPPQLGANYCQVFVGINNGEQVKDTCPSPEKINYITFTNPAQFGPNDFSLAGVGPCSSGIDVSSIP